MLSTSFNQYYNHTIHPELMRLERTRKRLIGLILASIIVLVLILIVEGIINEWAVTLTMMIPIGIYVYFLVRRMRRFRQQFKPRVVTLILDYLDDNPNFGELEYQPTQLIPKPIVASSGIFASSMDEFMGEDYIQGKIGEMPFGMSEIRIREFSQVRNRLNYVFSGVFMVAELSNKYKGDFRLWPREFKQYLTRALKQADKQGLKPVPGMMQAKGFNDLFLAVGKTGPLLSELITEEFQKALVQFRTRTNQPIYLAIHNSTVFIALTEKRDLLEPKIFQSNLSFDLIREFFRDIATALTLIQQLESGGTVEPEMKLLN